MQACKKYCSEHVEPGEVCHKRFPRLLALYDHFALRLRLATDKDREWFSTVPEFSSHLKSKMLSDLGRNVVHDGKDNARVLLGLLARIAQEDCSPVCVPAVPGLCRAPRMGVFLEYIRPILFCGLRRVACCAGIVVSVSLVELKCANSLETIKFGECKIAISDDQQSVMAKDALRGASCSTEESVCRPCVI